MDYLELKNDLLYDILEYLEIKKYPYNTRKQYSHYLKKIWDENSKLDKTTINKLLKNFKHHNQRAVLVLINNYCIDYGIDFRIVLPRITRKQPKEVVPLKVSEINALINNTPPPYDLALKCIFRIGAGLRVSEVIKLCWYHFEWVDWLQDKSRLGIVNIRNTKGNKNRKVTVPPKLMNELYEYARSKRVVNEFGRPQGGLIFLFGGDYKPNLRASNLERWKDEYIRFAYDWFRHQIIYKIGTQVLGHKIRVHQLRHTRATQLYNEKNIPIEIIQKQLGHSDINTTMVYTRVGDEMLKKAMEGID